nr:MAG TPA: hypothetical protein [Caudoviricetes sp.]
MERRNKMVVAPVDSAILRSDEMWELQEEYKRKFGEYMIPFNYADFDRIGDKCAAQVYKEELEKCLREGKPTSIVSKWCGPNSLFGH